MNFYMRANILLPDCSSLELSEYISLSDIGLLRERPFTFHNLFSPFLAVLGQTSKDSSSNVISPSGYEHYFIRT